MARMLHLQLRHTARTQVSGLKISKLLHLAYPSSKHFVAGREEARINCSPVQTWLIAACGVLWRFAGTCSRVNVPGN